MLTKIRSGVDHVIIRIILAIVALSFVGFGGVSFMSGNSKGTAISFSQAESISMEKFLRAKHQKIESIQNQNGINLTEDQINEFNIDQAVLQDLISIAMIDHIANQYDFDISDKQVISLAKHSPMFQNSDGEFDPKIYKSVFANTRHNEKEYLDFIRNQTIHGTIAGLFSTSFKVPRIMGDNMINFMAETKNVHVYKMNLSFKDKEFKPGTPDKELLQEIFNSNQKLLTLPEKRTFRYIKVTKDFLSKKITITEQDLKKYFEENPEEFAKNSYAKAKKEVKHLLTASILDDLLAEFSRKLEDDVAAGMSLEEISNKYTLAITEKKNISKSNLLNSKNEDHIELAEPIFEMISGEISYPIEIKDKHEILLTILDTITPERTQEFNEVEPKILELWKGKELAAFNLNKFVKFAEANNISGNAGALEKRGIKLIKKSALSRIDVNSNEIPTELFSEIFRIEDKTKTKIFQTRDGFAYFAYLEKSRVDAKKKKIVEEKGLEHFQNTIKESLLQEMIINMTLKNDVKVNIK